MQEIFSFTFILYIIVLYVSFISFSEFNSQYTSFSCKRYFLFSPFPWYKEKSTRTSSKAKGLSIPFPL